MGELVTIDSVALSSVFAAGWVAGCMSVLAVLPVRAIIRAVRL